MKKLAIFALIAAIGFGLTGCMHEKTQGMHNGNIVTNTVPMKAFNDETYVWESWWFGTNKVDKLD